MLRVRGRGSRGSSRARRRLGEVLLERLPETELQVDELALARGRARSARRRISTNGSHCCELPVEHVERRERACAAVGSSSSIGAVSLDRAVDVLDLGLVELGDLVAGSPSSRLDPWRDRAASRRLPADRRTATVWRYSRSSATQGLGVVVLDLVHGAVSVSSASSMSADLVDEHASELQAQGHRQERGRLLRSQCR